MDARNTEVGIDFLLNGEAVHIAPEPGEPGGGGHGLCLPDAGAKGGWSAGRYSVWFGQN